MTGEVPGAWDALRAAPWEAPLAGALAVACLLLLAAGGRLRWLRAELPTWPRRALGLTLLWGIFTTVVFLPTVMPGEAMDIDPETMAFPSLFAGHALLVVFLAAWWALAPAQPPQRFLHLQPATAADLRLGVQVGAAGWALALAAGAVVAMVLALLGWDGLVETDASGAPAPVVPPLIAWLADLPLGHKLVVIAVAMTVEEAFYRAFLQARLGLLASSVLFALSHAGYGLPTLSASVLVVSLAIGWAFRRRGRLLPCIVAHGFFDAVQLLIVLPLVVGQWRALAP